MNVAQNTNAQSTLTLSMRFWLEAKWYKLLFVTTLPKSKRAQASSP